MSMKPRDAVCAIDPDRLYPLSEACRLVPSPRAGRQTAESTLHRWRRQGDLVCQERRRGKKTWYFCYGADLLKAIGAEQPPAVEVRSPARRRRDHEKVMAELRELGMK